MITTYIEETLVIKRPQAVDDLGIKEHNWLVHQDIANDMLNKKNGLFSFSIKVVNGEITDYIVLENAKYNLSQIP